MNAETPRTDDGPEPPPPTAAAPVLRGPSNRRRLAVTALAPLVVVAGSLMPVPGIDHLALGALRTTGEPSVLALGIAPLCAAYLLVELAAVLVPRWRALRHQGPEGRAKLERAAAIVTLVIAAIQAFGMARTAQAADLLAGSGLVPPVVLSLSLVAGVAILVVVARAIQAHGLGNGMAVVVVSGLVVAEIGSLRNQAARVAGGVGPLDVAVAVVVAVALAAVTWLALGVHLGDRGDAAAAPGTEEARGIGYRDTTRRAGGLDAPLPVPASGAVPFSAPAILAAPPAMVVAWVGLPSPSSLAATLAVPVEIAATATLVVVLAILFNRPSRVAAVRAAAARVLGDDASGPPAETEARRELFQAVVRTLAFAGSVTAIQLGASAYVPLVPAAIPMVVAAALAADLGAEWRARRRRRDLVLVWPEARPHAVGPAAAALAGAGIEVHARGLFQRTMLQALGPWAPIELLVSQADAEQARGILARIFEVEEKPAPQHQPPSDAELDSLVAERARRRGKRSKDGLRSAGRS